MKKMTFPFNIYAHLGESACVWGEVRLGELCVSVCKCATVRAFLAT